MTARGSRGSSLAVSVLVTLLVVAGAIVLVVRLPGRAGEMAGKAAAQPLAVSAPPAPMATSARPARGASLAPGQTPPQAVPQHDRHHRGAAPVPVLPVRPVRPPGRPPRRAPLRRPPARLPPPGRCWP